MAEQCIFCKIVAGEIPAQVVHSDDEVLVFRDIEPQAPQHMLVIPRKHIVDIDHLQPTDEKVLSRLFAVVGEVARKERLSPDAGGNGYRLVANVGEDASNTVPHLHFHVIGGRSMAWPPG